ncbi:MAG: sigma 54-interacting transcriptional regulator [Proteobacteria bacterium]|nr:sigma 54-interacting transcriptional regulator [Pseudomonadota bacterium]
MADLRDIAARLRFAPEDGRIWLDDERTVLLRASVFAGLRRELLETLGVDKARALFTRIGYSAGARDATLAIKLRGGRRLTDVFAVGPQLHALEGFVAVEPIRIDIDVEQGLHYVEQLWHDSVEATTHMEAAGVAAEPVCWMQAGYASGFNSALFGRPILFREVECRGAGHAHCHIIGKPVDEWGDVEADLSFLRTEDFVNASLVRRRSPFEDASGAPVAPSDCDFMVGASSGFLSACHKLRQVAGTNAATLLLGETGVGKERFAKMLHRLSKRAEGPFVALNCAAIPENLLEAELFGVERGAYTGAGEARKGRFERADKGTLFLDEIGTLNEPAQAKLLRALQEREIERVGGSASRAVDVRVVAATNVDLAAAVREGRFRADLYYRLNVFPIRIPPLRERRDDIALLVNHFINKFSAAHGKRVSGFTHRAIAALLGYDYPGNVRELENLIERGLILAQEDRAIDRHHLFQPEEALVDGLLAMDPRGAVRPASQVEDVEAPDGAEVQDLVERALDLAMPLKALERGAMREAVKRANGNLSHAARLLGMSRAQLAYRLERDKEA